MLNKATIYLLVPFFFLTACSHEPLPEVNSLIETKKLVETDDYYQFNADGPRSSCLIFYQGGLVEELSYAPYLQRVAAAGYTSYLIKSPFDLAILDGDAADQITSVTTHCQSYVIAGHSLGGVVAAGYVLDKPDYGLLLLAAYPQDSKSLVNHPSPVVSISASLDGLTTKEKLEETKYLMPASTRWIEIVGGNHAQFGWYGDQDGDGVSEIGRSAQQQIVFEQTISLLNELSFDE